MGSQNSADDVDNSLRNAQQTIVLLRYWLAKLMANPADEAVNKAVAAILEAGLIIGALDFWTHPILSSAPTMLCG